LSPLLPTIFDVAEGGQTAKAAQVVFATSDFLSYHWRLDEGDREATASAFRDGAPVAVIDAKLQERLFSDRDPLGRTLSVAGKKFTLMAVSSGHYYHPNGIVWLPLPYYHDLKHRRVRDSQAEFYLEKTCLRGRPHDERQYVAAMAQLRDALLPMLPEQYRKGIWLSEHIPISLREFLFQHKAAAARGAVGALAVLLVALIGLTNMLLVSVNDQTREIGVRRALGARRPDILLHFLSEGVWLSAAGAAAGLVTGALICWATRTWAGLPISVSIFWAAAGAVATVLAGAAVSFIPAFIGAHVHPVEALRYE
ncbi:MAG: ABC transporter permease, partial [Armatimonadota bacterium]